MSAVDLSRGYLSGAQHCSSEEMLKRSAQAATVFDAAGVGGGDAVAVMLRNAFAFFEASYGAGMIGAFPVPINWHYKADEVEFILRDSGSKVLVIHADLLPEVRGAVPAGVEVLVVETPPEIADAYNLDVVPVPDDFRSWNVDVAAAAPWSPPSGQAPSGSEYTSGIIYTSGTTGTPKGVRRTERIDLESDAMKESTALGGIRPGMRTVVTGPMYHTAPNANALIAGRMGGLVVLQPKFDPEQLLAFVDQHRITAMHLVPTMFVRLLKLPEEVRSKYDVSSIEVILHGAAPCPPDVKRAMIDWWGPVLYEYYGGTETGPVVGCTSEEWLAHPGTVGKARLGNMVRIFDDDGRQLPPGEPGDVYAWNPTMGDFVYEHRPSDRLEIERDGLVTVGDIGFLDEDGFLFLCDRRRDMIISGGVNIYPAEIEAVLLGHPDVADCAVFGIPHDEFGESVVAVVQRADGATITSDDVRGYLGERLANFKVPRVVEFAEELPREDSGKIFKRKLRDRYWPEGRSI